MCAERPHAILHFAGGGSVGYSIANPLEDFERTVRSTAHVLEYVRKFSPDTRIIYASSASVYGAVNNLPISETSPRSPISPYGAHKAMAEQLIELYAWRFRVSAAVVRFFSVYGTGLRKQLLWDGCRKLVDGGMTFMGTGREVRDWLHVEDAAKLMVMAVEEATFECPIVNGGTGIGVCVRDILTELASNLSSPPEGVQFSGAERVGDPPAFVADISLAAHWGWQPFVPWRDGVAEYAGWWKETEPSRVSVGPESLVVIGPGE
jgi:UDP-glucose 4-epimerase